MVAINWSPRVPKNITLSSPNLTLVTKVYLNIMLMPKAQGFSDVFPACFWTRRVAIIMASWAAPHLDLPMCFFLGLTTWLDFGFRDVACFGGLNMASHEWACGRWMSQCDVTHDLWWEAVEHCGWCWDSHNGESFLSEYRSELYSPLVGVLRMKSIWIIFKTGNQAVSFWRVFKLKTISNLHRSLSYTMNFGVPNRL